MTPPTWSAKETKADRDGYRDSWLSRHRQKQRRAFWCGWVIVLGVILVLVGIAAVCLWVFRVGVFANLK